MADVTLTFTLTEMPNRRVTVECFASGAHPRLSYMLTAAAHLALDTAVRESSCACTSCIVMRQEASVALEHLVKVVTDLSKDRPQC